MNYSSTLYNSLPSLEKASESFINREDILSKLSKVFSAEPQGKRFGVCLVHRHCALEEGEKMVSNGYISQPELGQDYHYPERWLASGIPYEFSRDKTTSPPQTLVKAFQEIVGDVDFLGIFYLRDEDLDGIALERTQGRKNVITVIPPGTSTTNESIVTGWCLGKLLGTSGMAVLKECVKCQPTDGDPSHPQVKCC